jgi:hypothetical protein
VNRRRILLLSSLLAASVALGWVVVPRLRFPPDTTPAGAYMRIASAIGADAPAACFAYLEQDAQDAVYTILDYATKARNQVMRDFPAEARDEALAPYAVAAQAASPEALWASIATERGWVRRLRRDLSGVAKVEVAGDRATVVTARGTRYPLRRRPNGIWGLTIFTADLLADAARFARDWERIQQVAADYQRGTGR